MVKRNDEAASPARKRIAAARSDMILDEPFFGALALRLKLVEDPNALEPMSNSPSMWTDGTHLGFHPDFVMNLPTDELVGVIKHEVVHCSNGHPWRRDGRDPYRWNEACDRAINPELRDMGTKLPDGSIYELEPSHKGKSAEWIFDRLPPAEPKKQSQQSGSSGQPSGAGNTPPSAQQPQGSTGQGKQQKQTGGVIAMDGNGNIASPFNTEGMYHGWIDQTGAVTTRIFAAE